MTAAGVVEGGQIVPVEVKDSQVAAELIGPDNTFRKALPLPRALRGFNRPIGTSGQFTVQDEKFVLREGEWSGWSTSSFN